MSAPTTLNGHTGGAGPDRRLDVLTRRLEADPAAFRGLFLAEGMQAAAWEFRQRDLSEGFVRALWAALLRGDDTSRLLMRFIWQLPVGKKRAFMRGIDRHLSDRYPMFAGLSDDWPAGKSIPPYIREPHERSADFELVNQGFLGYMNVGYSAAEVDLFVWLEALRDKQCAESPCELGKLVSERAQRIGGCPVQIHIPRMLELVGEGRFREALELIQSANPLPDVTGRVCPQELQCQGVCLHKVPMAIGQIEWFLPQRAKLREGERADGALAAGSGAAPDPWRAAARPPVAVVGSGPSGLITAYLLAAGGFPVTVFEAFHELGGVLRYGIPEFRLPNTLIDDVVAKIRALGGRFAANVVIGRSATIQDLRDAGFWRVFVGTGAGLPRFMDIPGEHLLGVVSANEFLTRVNLMHAGREGHETPLQHVAGRHVIVVGGGNTAMDAARTARRLGGRVTIVYRRTREEMPARVEELEHALEEGIALQPLRSPVELLGDARTGAVQAAVLSVMELGEPDASGRRRPRATDQTETVPADLVVLALGNGANPILRDSEPRLRTTSGGALELDHEGSQLTTLEAVLTGGDAARGGSTAIRAAGDGQAAAREVLAEPTPEAAEVRSMVARAARFTDEAGAVPVIRRARTLTPDIREFVVDAPLVARAARAGQFVRVLVEESGELIPLTLADWDAGAGTVTLVVQGVGTSSLKLNRMEAGAALAGLAGPLGQPSRVEPLGDDATVVFVAGGLGLPPVHPILRAHLEAGNHATLISGFRTQDLMFWTGPGEPVAELQRRFGDLLDVVYATDDGSYGIHGMVTVPLRELIERSQAGEGRKVAEVVTIGPPRMMQAVAGLTAELGVPCTASVNSIMVDATGMCGACMVPLRIEGRLVRKHACIDGPELDAHLIDWDLFLPRFAQFRDQEQASRSALAAAAGV